VSRGVAIGKVDRAERNEYVGRCNVLRYKSEEKERASERARERERGRPCHFPVGVPNRAAPEETVPVDHAAFKTGCATRTCSH